MQGISIREYMNATESCCANCNTAYEFNKIHIGVLARPNGLYIETFLSYLWGRLE